MHPLLLWPYASQRAFCFRIFALSSAGGANFGPGIRRQQTALAPMQAFEFRGIEKGTEDSVPL